MPRFAWLLARLAWVRQWCNSFVWLHDPAIDGSASSPSCGSAPKPRDIMVIILGARHRPNTPLLCMCHLANQHLSQVKSSLPSASSFRMGLVVAQSRMGMWCRSIQIRTGDEACSEFSRCGRSWQIMPLAIQIATDTDDVLDLDVLGHSESLLPVEPRGGDRARAGQRAFGLLEVFDIGAHCFRCRPAERPLT